MSAFATGASAAFDGSAGADGCSTSGAGVAVAGAVGCSAVGVATVDAEVSVESTGLLESA